MGLGQNIRRAGLKVKETGSKLTSVFRRNGSASEPGKSIVKLSGKGVVAIICLVAVYYLVGAWIMSTIDDNMDFKPAATLQSGESAAVAMAVALIDREVNQHGWAANDPFFKPTAILDNMPNFQQGMVAALARFGFELTDQLGRTRGSSQADKDLQEAAGLLQYAGDKWLWDPTVSLLPTATSEQQYRKAANALRTYNKRLATGAATFERRSDNLLATLDRMALDLGSSSAVIDAHIEEKGGFFVRGGTDDIFYNVKGQLYGYYMILRALREDFSDVITERNLEKPWSEMLRSLEIGASQQPLVVLNGNPVSQLVPCHLCGQGFYLLRARTQLREITNILLK